MYSFYLVTFLLSVALKRMNYILLITDTVLGMLDFNVRDDIVNLTSFLLTELDSSREIYLNLKNINKVIK